MPDNDHQNSGNRRPNRTRLSKYLFTALVASAAAAAVIGALSLTALHAQDRGHAATPGRSMVADDVDHIPADRAICAARKHASAMMRQAVLTSGNSPTERETTTHGYDQAAAEMHRATHWGAHLDLSTAAQLYTEALQALSIIYPTIPEAFSAAAAAEETVTALCKRYMASA